MPKTVMTMIGGEDDGQHFDTPIPISEQCMNCIHQNKDKFSCSAYPEEIPAEIIMGEFDHTKPFPGDNGIMFVPRDKSL